METYQKERFEAAVGKTIDFVQDNQSVSGKFVLRGLHFQKAEASQAKLVRVVAGRALDVVADIRKGSPSFGKHFKTELSGENRKMLLIAKGLAHGFLALEDQTVFSYKCDAYYNASAEDGIIYNDPDLKIDWEVDPSLIILSDKDLQLSSFQDLWR